MALIKCPECGSEISSEAVRCPNCGVPAEVWAEEISSSYSPPVASKNNSEEKHIVECCEESKGKGRFNKIIAAIVIVLLVALLGVAALKLTSNHLIGRSKSEAEYRSAVYAHITDSHGEAIDSYVDAPDKSSGKRVQHIHIKYDGIGFIPLNELLKEETA